MKLKRIAPGAYETLDGKFGVYGFQRPCKDDYGPANEWIWYWRRLPYGEANDQFATKRDAVAALTAWVEYEAVR